MDISDDESSIDNDQSADTRVCTERKPLATIDCNRQLSSSASYPVGKNIFKAAIKTNKTYARAMDLVVKYTARTLGSVQEARTMARSIFDEYVNANDRHYYYRNENQPICTLNTGDLDPSFVLNRPLTQNEVNYLATRFAPILNFDEEDVDLILEYLSKMFSNGRTIEYIVKEVDCFYGDDSDDPDDSCTAGELCDHLTTAEKLCDRLTSYVSSSFYWL